ncbi:MAG TPA: 3-hydroxyacyl-CoA dehydrogenase NAD-binding domain-containing protein, partial [Bdellovibrionota bacterium]|nr:3-hydroxyacyl-CoA dehydrogenase NAD-binding domain-containing protein [Bdellovibrionota bacterium]
MSQTAFTYTIDKNNIVTLTFDLKGEKVNKLSRAVGQEFQAVLKEISSKPNIKGIVLVSGKPGIFIAGADIEEFTKIKSKEEAFQLSSNAQKLVDQIEDLPFPTVAAIDGVCLGGGLEVALGCTARVATDDPKTIIGAPEVMLGIIPGMGGCYRTPKLIGLEKAFGLILAGNPVDGKKAKRLGLVDKVVAKAELINAAKSLIKKPRRRSPSMSVKSLLLERNPLGRFIMGGLARKGVISKTYGHYPAPLKAIDVILQAYGKSRKDALEIEARGFAEMAITDVSKQLVRLFFLQEEAKKERGEEKSLAGTEINSVAVLGAGVMGGGIAYLVTTRGIPVIVKDINEEALKTAVAHARELYDKQVSRWKMTKDDMAKKMMLIKTTMSFEGFNDIDLVIEAVPEKLELKEVVYRDLCKHVREDTIIASNTSTFALAMLKPSISNPKRFIGMHFFNPVHKLPLLEIVRTKDSDPGVVASAMKFGQKLGKVTLLCNDG